MDYLNLYVLTKQDYDLGWITDDSADREIWTYNNQEIQTLVDEPDQYWFFKNTCNILVCKISYYTMIIIVVLCLFFLARPHKLFSFNYYRG